MFSCDFHALTRRAIAIAVAVFWSLIANAQPAAVRVVGPRMLTVSMADLEAMPRTKVATTLRGQPVNYEGVSIRELLTRAGLPNGEALRGSDLAAAVLVTGADGYQVAFGVAEFDPAFTDRLAILADRKDGKPLTGTEAPFQLVLTGEKRPARWVRQVNSIEVRPLASTSK